ncbi:MAG: tetratricopeptide (TPR) repeat protein [Bacteroidia bacterium]|jgi:tetratricopeptide (TPR) repeat protein
MANFPWLEAAGATALGSGLVFGDYFGPAAGLDSRRLCIALGLLCWLLSKRPISQIPTINGTQLGLGTIGIIGLVGLVSLSDPLLAGTRLADMGLLSASYWVARSARLRHGPMALIRLLAWSGFAASFMGIASLWLSLPGQLDAGAGSLGTRNLCASFCALCLAPALVLRNSPWGLLQLGVIASYLALSGNRLGLLAGAIATGAVLLVLGKRRIGMAKGLPILFATGLCLAAAGVVSTMPKPGSTSVIERLHLAEVTLDQLPSAGLFGQGPGTWRLNYPQAAAGKAQVAWSERFDRQPNGDITLTASRQPAHAHQDFLELTHEFGLVGLACLLFALGRGFWPLSGGARLAPAQLAARGGLLGFITLAMGLFPLAEPLCLLALGCLLALAGPLPTAALSRRQLGPARLVVLGICAVSLVNLGFGRTLANSRQAAESGDFDSASAALVTSSWSFESARYGAWLESVCGRHGNALEHAQTANRLRPGHPGAMNDLALVLRHFDRDDEAVDLLREAHRLIPQDPEVALNLGQALMDKLEAQLSPGGPSPRRVDLAGPTRLFQVAVDGNANLVPGWRGLARCAALSGDPAMALRFHEESRAAALRCQIAAGAPNQFP